MDFSSSNSCEHSQDDYPEQWRSETRQVVRYRPKGKQENFASQYTVSFLARKPPPCSPPPFQPWPHWWQLQRSRHVLAFLTTLPYAGARHIPRRLVTIHSSRYDKHRPRSNSSSIRPGRLPNANYHLIRKACQPYGPDPVWQDRTAAPSTSRISYALTFLPTTLGVIITLLPRSTFGCFSFTHLLLEASPSNHHSRASVSWINIQVHQQNPHHVTILLHTSFAPR